VDCCLLSPEEVGQLRNYRIEPNCENHVHITADAAIKGINDDEYELVEGTRGRHYVTRAKMYYLRATPSGGRGAIPIIQRVVSNQLKHLKPIKF